MGRGEESGRKGGGIGGGMAGRYGQEKTGKDRQREKKQEQGREEGKGEGDREGGEKVINVYIIYKSVCVAIVYISEDDITMDDIVKSDGASARTYSASTPRP